MQECPRCGAYLKDDLQNCPYCKRNLDGAPPAPTAQSETRKQALSATLVRHLVEMPLLSIPAPFGWEYDSIGLVTAQSVTGTGLFADVGSIFTDAFGLQSGMYVNKIKHGEELCQARLRLDAMRLDAHAVIGIDVDYADVGGVKSMLMVCMTGTAVRLRNLDVLPAVARDNLGRATELMAELKALGG